MPYYTSLGQLPPKRHTQFRRPDGVLYSEEVFGTEGFVGPTSTIYHIHPPTQVTGWKTLYSTKQEYVETDVMRMRHVKTAPMQPKGVMRGNWIQTDPKKGWFQMLRFYFPAKAFFDKSWQPGETVLVK